MVCKIQVQVALTNRVTTFPLAAVPDSLAICHCRLTGSQKHQGQGHCSTLLSSHGEVLQRVILLAVPSTVSPKYSLPVSYSPLTVRTNLLSWHSDGVQHVVWKT